MAAHNITFEKIEATPQTWYFAISDEDFAVVSAAVERGDNEDPGNFTIPQVYTYVTSGLYDMYLMRIDAEVQVVFLCQILPRAGRAPILEIPFIAGRPPQCVRKDGKAFFLEDYRQDMIWFFQGVAHNALCSEIRGYMREGWARVWNGEIIGAIMKTEVNEMHRLIVGKTGSGKTTLAKYLAHAHWKQGAGVYVFDAQEDAWAATAQFGRGQLQEFMSYLFDEDYRQPGAVFVDEAGLSEADLRRTESNRLVSDARHRGFALYFICHRIKHLSPTIRGQCDTVYAFRLGRRDAEEAAQEWDAPGDPLLKTPLLQQYQFLKQTNFKPPEWYELRST